MTIDRLQPQVEVRINGVARTLLGGSCTQGVRSAFPTATLALDPSEGQPSPGDLVEVYAGYASTGTEITFTGEIDVNGIDLAPNTITVQATHILARMQEPIGAPPTIVDGEASQEYFLAWEGATASTIIADLADAYGIPNRTLEDSGRTFGNLEPVGLMASDNGWDFIKQLDEVEGYQTFGVADGSIRRVPFIGIPSGLGRTLTQGIDLYGGKLDESRVNTRNRVIASGLPQTGTTGVDFVPTAERDAASPWIPTPPGYRSVSFNSPLFETEDEADAYCARKLGELNRLRGEMPFELVTGDQTLRPGMSIAVDAAKLNVRANVRFRVLEVVHSFDDGFHTSGTLLLASIGAGWSPNEAPIAIIAASAKVEYLGDGTKLVVVSLDGSASYDPELGKDGIVSYIWTGSPVTPTPMQSGQRANAVYVGGIPSGATITLTVTDDLGKTGSATIKPAAGGVKLKVRHLISAEKTRLQVSRDGCKTWQNVTYLGSPIAAVGTCEFAAALYTFAWDSGGNLYKVLADNTATLVLSGAGVTACGITLVNGDPAQPTGRVWTASADGSVRRSRADGDVGTWDVLAPLPNGQAATYILESAFAEGDVEAAGGNVYYRTFDNAATWTAQVTHPNTALIARRVASGFGKGWVGFAGGSGGADAGASRIKERADTVTLDALEPAKPISIQGLALDPYEDTAYVLDIDNGGIGRAFTGDTSIGGNLADTEAWDTVAWGVPRHMVRDGTAPGYLYISAVDSLLKSVDGLASILELKLLSGGPEGMMIGYGAEGVEPPPPAGDLVWHGSSADGNGNRWIYRLTTDGFSRVASPLDSGHKADGMHAPMVVTTGGALLLYSWDESSVARSRHDEDNAYRSTDGGLTWDLVADLPYCVNIQPGAGGAVYAATMPDSSHITLMRSDDDGATWTEVQNQFTSVGPGSVVLPHPSEPLTLLLKYQGWHSSTDGGATLVDLHIDPLDQAGLERGAEGGYTPDGTRFLWYPQQPTGQDLRRAAAAVDATTDTVTGVARPHTNIFVAGADGLYNYGQGAVIGSNSQGATWDTVLDQSRLPSDDTSWRIAGFVPGDAGNDWYALPGGLGALALLRRDATAEAGEMWADLTADLDLAFPDTDYFCYLGGAVRLPGEGE